MTTNVMDDISKMFVVLIIYMSAVIVVKFNIVDLLYLIFVTGSFIQYIYINIINSKEEWQTFFFSL